MGWLQLAILEAQNTCKGTRDVHGNKDWAASD